jgi:Fe-S-cluster containining protein
MLRDSRFSYVCHQCGRCCHNQVVTLSPYDVIRLARAARTSTGEVVANYTIRRGSILKFDKTGACTFLDGASCKLHSGRPLACRLYPLGLEHRLGAERYLRLEPAAGSRGVYGVDGTVEEFLAAQGVEVYLQINRTYARLLGVFQQRITELTDFEVVEPREFWRVAVREALAETNFDFNPIITTLFDPDSVNCRCESELEFVGQHVKAIEERIASATSPGVLAAAAVILAVSLGYSPTEAMIDRASTPGSCVQKRTVA